MARTLHEGDPFSLGKGTDGVNLVYIADGIGEISLDSTLSDPVFVNKDSYKDIRETLTPYNQFLLDIVEERNLW